MIAVRDWLFEALNGFRGYPVRFGKDFYRLDASLRRWNTDGESAVREAIRNALSPGDWFADLGANFGLHTLPAADVVGPAGRVFAFEPMPRNAALLRRNLKLNRFAERVTVEEAAVSDGREPTLTLHASSAGLTMTASFEDSGNGGHRHEVRNLQLDDYTPFAERPPDVVKIDVEGAELKVLLGGRQLLTAAKPKLILEVHPNIEEDAALALLTEFGYSVRSLEGVEREEGREFHLFCEAT